jgi:hypothetical protein
MTKKLSVPQMLIIAFCLWHMAAVTLYLLPQKGPRIVRQAKNLTQPYILVLSQWQQWNIFAPDPMRRVKTYRIEQQVDGEWESVVFLDTENIPWWQRAKELKVPGRLDENWHRLTVPYLESYCDELAIENTDLRLIVRYFVLPADKEALSRMSGTTPDITEKIMVTTTCPHTS